MKRHELDGAHGLFGWMFDHAPGQSSNGLVHIYAEDDENYTECMCFDVAWLREFVRAAKVMRNDPKVQAMLVAGALTR